MSVKIISKQMKKWEPLQIPNGIAQMGDLPAGKYYVKEVKPPMVMCWTKSRDMLIFLRDQDTPVITYDEKWQNARQKDYGSEERKNTERVLTGGVFGLYTSRNIKMQRRNGS